MNIYYYYRFSGGNKTGVDKKVISQIKNLSDLGVNCTLFCICLGNEEFQYPEINVKNVRLKGTNKKGISNKINREKLVNIEFENLIQSLNHDDIIYMRSPYPSPQISRILKNKRRCKIVIEYQTIEPLEYKTKKKYWYLLIDYLFGNDIRKYTDGIVGVTEEITQYQLSRSGNPSKPHITIGNGFDINSVPIRNPPEFSGDELHLLCVANVSPWHGLDRLIRGMAEYKGPTKVVLHIAGDGSEVPVLKNLAKNLNISDQVIFHSFLSGKDLDILFDKCHIAVGSLGIQRKGLKQTSELKAREYCARGMPFVIACDDPDFPKDFPYILHLPPNESLIDIKQVIAFTERIFVNPENSRKMCEYAIEHLDWSVKMKKLKGSLEDLVYDNDNV
ncbi:glycosyltransferase family 4 protein [Methanoplanus limicola]|uniref:Glycosyl transferase group 1 n=1 Tax=Methanoplanus limicola DSM 2279 TaxID=937775 RepID=H1Z4E3_9EURY|nr:glycosyltransferase family 4 protein [Methanoplanus limicola]EHQ36691.1 glycosyl transferase group 1 [Methanoplanus limicola DSM 2279]